LSFPVHARFGRRTLFTIGPSGIEVPGGRTIAWSQITRFAVRRSFKNRLVVGFDVTDDAPRHPLRYLALVLRLPEWSWSATGLDQDIDAILGAVRRQSPGTPIDVKGM
jgi:hypothetical protein